MTDDAKAPPPAAPPERHEEAEPSAEPKAEAEPSSPEADVPEEPTKLEKAQAAAPGKQPNPWIFFALWGGFNVVADLGTKWWAIAKLDQLKDESNLRRIEIVKGYISMSIISAKNRGGAWGILQSESDKFRLPFFQVISVAAIIFIISLYRKLTPQQTALKWGLPLVFGGAIGNFVDRLRFHYVVDFIDVSIGTYHWPTFNVADIAIVVGVGLMGVDMFTSRKNDEGKPATPEAPAS